MTSEIAAPAAPTTERADDDRLRDLLAGMRTIAMVGASPKPDRPSNDALRYFLHKGLAVVPVNPGHAGREICGITAYGALADVPAPFDLVNLFVSGPRIAAAVDEAIALKDAKGIRAIWMQMGVADAEAAARAEAAGLAVVMNRCMKHNYRRLVSRTI